MIINEKYLIFFYILSFFLLISLILIYKKSKIVTKGVTFFAIIILVIQTCIVYDTYPIMEHLTNVEVLNKLKTSLEIFYKTDENAKNLIDLKSQNPLGTAYARANSLMDEQTGRHTNNTDMLTAVNVATGKTYATFDDLPKYDPNKMEFHMNTFNKKQIGNIITEIRNTYMNALDAIITATSPIARP